MEYKLEDFKTWLEDEENLSNMSGADKNVWEYFVWWYEEYPNIWEETMELGMAAALRMGIPIGNLTEYDKTIEVLQKTIFVWKRELDKLRPKLTTIRQYLTGKKRIKKINIEEIILERKRQGFFKGLDGGELDLREYSNLEKVEIKGGYLETPLTELRISDCVNFAYLDCSNNRLISLDVSGCNNLNKISCYENKLFSLNFLDCANISYLDCSGNYLVSTNFLEKLSNPGRLTWLDISNNNFPMQNLSVFSKFNNLETLRIGKSRFFGSLEFLKNCQKLKSLFIINNSLDPDLEYLPESLEEFYCDGKLAEELKDYGKEDVCYNYQSWRKDHLELVKLSQKNGELKNILNKLNLAFGVLPINNNIINKGLLSDNCGFTLWIKETIADLEKKIEDLNTQKVQNRIEVLPKCF